MVEVFGNLNLHVVGDALVLLDAGKEFHELVGVGLAQKLLHHAKHTLDALGEGVNLLLCLQYGDFRGLHDTRLDEAQAEVILVGVLLRTDNLANQFLHLWDEPYQDEGVGEVEGRVEGCKHEGQLGCVGIEARGAFFHFGVEAYPAANEVDEGLEHTENPEHAEYVEHHVRHRRPSGLRVGGEGCHVGGDGRADVLAHHEGDALVDGQYAGGTEYHRNRHDGCRTLHTHGEHTAYD